jgi:hypothetical protein
MGKTQWAVLTLFSVLLVLYIVFTFFDVDLGSFNVALWSGITAYVNMVNDFLGSLTQPIGNMISNALGSYAPSTVISYLFVDQPIVLVCLILLPVVMVSFSLTSRRPHEQEVETSSVQVPVISVSEQEADADSVDNASSVDSSDSPEAPAVSKSRPEVSMKTLNKLSKLKSLWDSGAITIEEFKTLKSSLLEKDATGSPATSGESKTSSNKETEVYQLDN